MSKRKNPARLPVSQADLNRAKAVAQEKAVDTACALTLTVLHDKFGFEKDELIRYWRELNSLADSIAQGYVSCPDLESVLLEECEIELKRSKK